VQLNLERMAGFVSLYPPYDSLSIKFIWTHTDKFVGWVERSETRRNPHLDDPLATIFQTPSG
jgi:hypothetical protein